MGFHFEPNTTIDRIHIGAIIQTMKNVRDCRGQVDPRVAEVCEARGFLRRDPCDEGSFLLTDLGNHLRSAVVGERVPLAAALMRFQAFMDDVCLTYEERRVEDGEVAKAWLFGSLMRKEPTIGDIDLYIELPGRRKPEPFFSITEDSLDLRMMAIPCQEISITCEQGCVSWQLIGQPGLFPGNTSLEDPPGPVSIDTDKGRFRTGTPDEAMVMETVATVRELIANGETVPLPLAATLRRDLIARYADGANSGEAAAILLGHMGEWRNCPEGQERFRETILQIETEPDAFEPGF